MSHFTTIQTQIHDVSALRAACEELGVRVLTNTQARGYGSNKLKGDLVIRLNGPYDIAVNQQPDGAFGLTTDWWGQHVEKEVGANYGKLLQRYGVCKAAAEARRKGYTTRRQSLKDGSIKLTI
ncbi:MAG: DUF1257 domain-containing protein, partial [Verrucomicrobia bacterium]|nr:DUF1257 domain-containing protein [Verrucomicrobiota bacterium]